MKRAVARASTAARGCLDPGVWRRDPRHLSTEAARQWVDATLKKLSLEQLVGQMIFAPFQSTYLSSDSDSYDALVDADSRIAHRRRDRVRRHRSGPAGDVERHLRPGDPRPADGAGLDPQPAAVDLGVAAADLVGLRVGRADAHCRRHEIPARDGVWRHRRSAAGLRSGQGGGRRSAGARRARELRAGGRRQQQPAQPGDQHPIVRRGSEAGGRDGDRLGARAAGSRHARHAQAFSRARRHRASIHTWACR